MTVKSLEEAIQQYPEFIKALIADSCAVSFTLEQWNIIQDLLLRECVNIDRRNSKIVARLNEEFEEIWQVELEQNIQRKKLIEGMLDILKTKTL